MVAAAIHLCMASDISWEGHFRGSGGGSAAPCWPVRSNVDLTTATSAAVKDADHQPRITGSGDQTADLNGSNRHFGFLKRNRNWSV